MSNFSSELSSKLHGYYEYLEKTLIPNLKSDLRNFQTMMETMMKILLKKGIIIQDPYKYEEKISDITPVSTETFPDSERLNEMSARLAQFMARLDYLNNYLHISVDTLDFNRLKSLAAFLKFINWDNLSLNHPESHQRAMAHFFSRASGPDDPLSTGLIKDAVNQLNIIQKRIFEAFRKITFFKREEYKALVRNSLENILNEARKINNNDTEEALKFVKKGFSTHIRGQTFIPELIKEIFQEDDPEHGEPFRQDLLKKLTVEQPKKKKPTIQDFKPMLLETLRQLSNTGPILESALKKLNHNSALLEDKKMTWGEHFNLWLKNLLGKKDDPRVYEVELYDTQTAVVRPERIDFDAFIEVVEREAKQMGSIALKNSPLYVKLIAKPEKEILNFINEHFVDLSRIVEKINALDVYFKTEMPKSKKNAIKGTKLEVMQIKTFLTAANKSKLEYLNAVEEVEQLKRLGINLDN